MYGRYNLYKFSKCDWLALDFVLPGVTAFIKYIILKGMGYITKLETKFWSK
ncbi:MAG: hypothetical protein ACI9LM_001851 [Alteromonadaceae bacterium]|jgi:hypothetical protein